jgi:hypothetical protein
VPVHLGLTLLTGLDLGTGILLWRLLVRVGIPRAAPWASAFWFLSPFSMLVTLRGLEGSLSAFVVAGASLVAIEIFDRSRASAYGAAALGALLGLAGLARTDNWLFLGAALTATTVAAWRSHRWPVAGALRFLAILGAVAACFALPWFLWNQAVFGSPWQVSGAAKLSNPQLYGHLSSAATRVRVPGFLMSFLRLCLTPMRFALGEEFTPPRLAWLALGLAGFAALSSVPLLRRLRDMPFAARVAALGAAIFLLSHVITYAWVIHSYVSWYAAIPLLIAAAWFGFCASELTAAIPARNARAILAGALTVIAAAIAVRFFSLHPIVPRGEERKIAPGLSLITRTHAEVRTVGACNAGALGYFAPEYGSYRVVNLDGLVNNRAYDAWRQGDYEGYLVRTIDLIWVEPEDWDMWLTAPEISRIQALYPRWAGSDIYGPRARGASAIFDRSQPIPAR